MIKFYGKEHLAEIVKAMNYYGDTSKAEYLNYTGSSFLDFNFLVINAVCYDKGSDFTKEGFLATKNQGYYLNNSEVIFQDRVKYSQVDSFSIEP